MFLIELKGTNVFRNRVILGYINDYSDFDKVKIRMKNEFNIEIDGNVVQCYDNPLIFKTKDDRDIEVVVTQIYQYL